MSHATCPDLQVFPAEIFDRIIDLSLDDPQTLAAAALVCSEWLPGSRRHLFKKITIRPSTLREFSELCSHWHSHTFIHLIKHIDLFNDRFDISLPPIELVNKDFLSRFPSLPSANSISFYRIKWDSAETLAHFGTLVPNIIDIELHDHTIDKISSINDLIRTFPFLTSFSLCGCIPTDQGSFIDIPQSVSSRMVPCHLQSLVLSQTSSRDEFIRNIPFGSIQLSEFDFRICSAESPDVQKNLLNFIRGHCLKVSTLKVGVIVAQPPSHWDNFFETDFVQIFSEFKDLASLQLIILAEVDGMKLPAWVYDVLDRVNPTSDIRDLQLVFQVPVELDLCLREMPKSVTEHWEYQKYFELPRLGAILRQNKFRNVMPIPVWIAHDNGDKSVWFSMIDEDRRLDYQTQDVVLY